MAQLVTKSLQDSIKEIVETFKTLRNEGKDIYNVYWKGSVNTDISGLASGDPAAKTAKLTKAELTNGLSMIEALNNFWENAAVAQSDYQVTIQACLHGDAVLATALSSDTEDFADRLKQFAQDLLTQYNRARIAVNLYTNSEVSGAVSGISSHTVVFGADMTKDDLTSAVTLLNQFIGFVENQAVTTGDYKSTLAKWERI